MFERARARSLGACLATPQPQPPCPRRATQASLEELNRQLAYKGERELPMARFRPNLVVAGARAFAEDGWATLAVGGAGPAGDGGVQFDK